MLDRAGLRSLRSRVIVAQLASLLLVALWASIASFCSFLPLLYWAGLVMKLFEQRRSVVPVHDSVRTISIWLSLLLILSSGLVIAILPMIAFHQVHFLGEMGILMPFVAGFPACLVLVFHITGPRNHTRLMLLAGVELSTGLLLPVVCSALFIFASQLVTVLPSDTVAPMWQNFLQGISYVLMFDALHRIISSYEPEAESDASVRLFAVNAN